MNRQICDKIKFMLWGMTSRIEENKDFINSISFLFKSGLKEYKGIYFIDENKVNFNGKDTGLSTGEIPQYIAEESINYDSLEFFVDERGKTTMLYADNKGVKTKQVDSTNNQGDDGIKTSHILNRNYYIKVGEADALLKEIGILTKEGKIKNDMIRKYNQIDHFVELVDGMIDKLMDSETITVLDCGCGKSYLTFVLNYYIKEIKKKNCYFIGIDRSGKVIKASRDIAKRLGYKNMEFIEGDINNYNPEKKIDLVISLHACDIATDMALGVAVRVNSRAIMCVPCCHKEILSQYSSELLEPVIKHGVFKARFADMLTDGIRALLLETQGYKVSVVEYISPLETPKNLLMRAVKAGERNQKAIEEYRKLKQTFNIEPYLERYLEEI